MKRILIMMLALGLVYGAEAQGVKNGRIRSSAPRITYVMPRVPAFGMYSPFYPAFGLGYGFGYGFSPFYGPYMSRQVRPTQLDLQVEEIRNDYRDRIKSARRDDSLSAKDRRAVIRKLRQERANEIVDAKRNYYKTERKVIS